VVNNGLGMVIGAEIDRDEGRSGLGGAIGGYLIEGVARAIAPVIVIFALGWGMCLPARQLYKRPRS